MLTNLDFLSPGQKWPPESEKDRLQLYQDNKDLFEGEHNLVFKDWIRILRDDQKATLELILNWHARLTKLWCDLLLGEEPHIRPSDDDQTKQDALEDTIKKLGFINTSYEVVIDISRFGTGIYKSRYNGKKALIEAVPPSIWFPVVSEDNIKDVLYHVLAWTYTKDKYKYLKAEIHEVGKITTKVFLINQKEEISQEISSEELLTGVDDFLIVPAHNMMTSDRIVGKDDYSDLETIVQELEIRIAQISRILDKHADPSMTGPDTAMERDPATGQLIFNASSKYFPAMKDDAEMKYVVWDGKLDSAFKEIDLLINQLFIISETTAAAFGDQKQGLATSGSALRRLMMAPLAKVNRLRMRLSPAMENILVINSKLEAAQGVPEAVVIDGVHIDWQDGLPKDDTEQATVESTLKNAGLTSLEAALVRLFGYDEEALKQEMDKITKERQAEMPQPPVIKMPGGGGNPNGQGSNKPPQNA